MLENTPVLWLPTRSPYWTGKRGLICAKIKPDCASRTLLKKKKMLAGDHTDTPSEHRRTKMETMALRVYSLSRRSSGCYFFSRNYKPYIFKALTESNPTFFPRDPSFFLPNSPIKTHCKVSMVPHTCKTSTGEEGGRRQEYQEFTVMLSFMVKSRSTTQETLSRKKKRKQTTGIPTLKRLKQENCCQF